ncbi:GGDEF domain-containing protein [Romboutsia sp.]|uniref:GGDEF domain-containing protein n=1 Tax=Romboutsia sp. TaxID=1965302 RepID=UPI003F66FCAB
MLIFKIINDRLKNQFVKWFLKLIMVLLVSNVSLLYLLWDNEIIKETLVTFSITLLSVGSLEFFLLEYVRRSNEALRMYKENSTKDHLTGLNNTRNFDTLTNYSFNAALESNEKLSCLMIDIDHFKRVNDTYGHAVGDIVLKELAGILIKSCRTFDIVGRVGGEEFCVILLDSSIERSFEIGLRIKNTVKEHDFPIGNNQNINITVSVGISTFPDTIADPEYLKQEADKALYLAKQSGRNKVCNKIECSI